MAPAAKLRANWWFDTIVKGIVSVTCLILVAACTGAFKWAWETHATLASIQATIGSYKSEQDDVRRDIVNILDRLTKLEEGRRTTDQFRPAQRSGP